MPYTMTPAEQAEFDELKAAMAEATHVPDELIPACPGWCALPSGHAYNDWDGCDTATLLRVHESVGVFAQVTQMESNRFGAVSMVEAANLCVHVGDNDQQGVRSPEDSILDARRAAADLLAAASLLEQIVAAA